MNELPVIESLRLRKDFWDRHRANIATRQKMVLSTIYMFTFSARFPGIFLFLTRSSKEFEEKRGSSKAFRFFSTNYLLTKGFPFSSYFILPKSNSLVKIIFISADDDVSALRRHIFRHRNLFI